VFATRTEESEIAVAKMKGLDETKSKGPEGARLKGQAGGGGEGGRPRKDVNTFINNQLKFVSGSPGIPPEQMKCNILKAKVDERHNKGDLFI
jgi:hypothetical protein